MSFKDWMIKKIGYENYVRGFPSHYAEIEVIVFAEEWHKSELNNLLKPDVMRSVADAVGRNCPFCGEPCAECSHKANER